MQERILGYIVNAMGNNIVSYVVKDQALFEEGFALNVHSPSIEHTKKIKKFFSKLEDVHCEKITGFPSFSAGSITLMFD